MKNQIQEVSSSSKSDEVANKKLVPPKHKDNLSSTRSRSPIRNKQLVMTDKQKQRFPKVPLAIVNNLLQPALQAIRATHAYLYDTERIPVVVMLDKRVVWKFKGQVDKNGALLLPMLTALVNDLLATLTDETIQQQQIPPKEEQASLDYLVYTLLDNWQHHEVVVPPDEQVMQFLTKDNPYLQALPPAVRGIATFLSCTFALPLPELLKLGIIALSHSVLLDTYDTSMDYQGVKNRFVGSTYEQLYHARQPKYHYRLW
jgi:hypothetical protein